VSEVFNPVCSSFSINIQKMVLGPSDFREEYRVAKTSRREKSVAK